MAEQHWVKYYRIKPENVHDDGTIDDDSPLYPYYSMSYKVNGPTEKFNEPIEYDQTSNTDHGQKSGVKLKDLRTGELFNTGLKRGFSVNGYVKGADGLLWTPKGDDSGAIIDPSPTKHSVIPSKDYTDSTYSDKLERASELALPTSTSEGELLVLPTIVTADDDDLVRYYDYKYNGYNPERDSIHEQMLKRIKYRRLPGKIKYKKRQVVKAIYSRLASVLKDIGDYVRNDKKTKALKILKSFEKTENMGSIDNDILYHIDNIRNYLAGSENIDFWDELEQAENAIDDVKGGKTVFSIENFDPETWFPKNIISSDERLKDIEGSADSDWIDFGNNHKKHIYDDFMKWYDNSCTQRDIANCLGDRL